MTWSPAKARILLAAGAGTIFSLCWLPLGVAPVLPVAALLAMRGLRRASRGREAAAFGAATASVFYLISEHFFVALTAYSAIGIVLYALTTLYAVALWIVCCWGAFWLDTRGDLPRSIGFGLLYVLLEKVRTMGDLSFPGDPFSHCFGRQPSFLAWNSWLGPFGFTALVLVVAWLFDQAMERRARPARAVLLAGVGVALWLAPPITDVVVGGRETGLAPSVRVGIVQPAVTIDDKLKRERWPALWERMEKMTLEAAGGSDLVVWPESSRPGPVLWKEPSPFADPEMQRLADRAGVPILYGCEIARLRDGRIVALYNGAALARPGGGASAWYGKQRLLPFVEGIPFANLLGWDPASRRQGRKSHSYLTLAGNFYPGPEPTVFSVGPAKIGVLICYEGLYPQLARRYRLEGANVLCVITNDAWWGRTIFPMWHALMVSSRARELGVPVLRAANNGISSVTDASGRMRDKTRLGEITVLHTTVTPAISPPTFYARYGNWAVWIALVAVVLAAGRGVGRRKTG